VRVGVRYFSGTSSGSGAYSLEFEHALLPDVIIREITIGPESADPAPAQTQGIVHRKVHIDVANQGAGDAEEVFLAVSVHQRAVVSDTARRLGTDSFRLAAGESRLIEVSWDATGEVGEATVDAEAYTEADANLENNDRSAYTHALLPYSAGLGVDAANTVAGFSLNGWGATAGTWYDSDAEHDRGAGAVAFSPYAVASAFAGATAQEGYAGAFGFLSVAVLYADLREDPASGSSGVVIACLITGACGGAGISDSPSGPPSAVACAWQGNETYCITSDDEMRAESPRAMGLPRG
jgi:hypothetical protein